MNTKQLWTSGCKIYICNKKGKKKKHSTLYYTQSTTTQG
jgi:hypothetical protein